MNNPMEMIKGNPLFQLLNLARGGGNPVQLLQQMASRNPQAAQVVKMIEGKNPQEIQTMCKNMCKERGTTVEQVAHQLGILLPR